jgi:hypothetical protein
VVRWFGNNSHGGELPLEQELAGEGGAAAVEEEETEAESGGAPPASSLVDYDLFLQHFWALGALPCVVLCCAGRICMMMGTLVSLRFGCWVSF